jgi:AGCS family alanine or glycine:cation symporter
MLATVTDWLWSYVLIVALLAVGIRLSVTARFVQIRLFKEMFRDLLGGFSATDKGPFELSVIGGERCRSGGRR